VNQFLK